MLIIPMKKIVFVSLFIWCGLYFQASFASDISQKVPENVLKHRAYAAYFSDVGYFIAQRDRNKNTQVFRYDLVGNPLWTRQFKNRKLVSYFEGSEKIYLVFFERSKTSGKRYLEGAYTLYTYHQSGECERKISFDEGVMDIVVDEGGIWTLEYNFNEIYYAVEAGPVAPYQSTLKGYAKNTYNQIETHTIEGARALGSKGGDNLLVEVLYSSSQKFEEIGIFTFKNGVLGTKKIGGFRPFEQIPGSYQSICSDFIYDEIKENTYCFNLFSDLSDHRNKYEVQIIKNDKSATNRYISFFSPYLSKSGDLYIVKQSGKKTAIGSE